MLRKYIVLFLLLTSPAHAENVPVNIEGVWEFDVVRTMSAQVDGMPANLAAKVNPEHLALVEKQFLSQPSQVTLTITSETITLDTVTSGEKVMEYTVIGGNARLVILEYVHQEGDEGIGKIHLVEGGIAFEQTDCEIYPQQCEVARQRAFEALKATQQNGVVAGLVVDSSAQQSVLGGTVSEPLDPTRSMGPKLAYFKARTGQD